MTWKIAKNTENMKNEKCTRQDLDYGEKTNKPVKCDKNTVKPGIWREN